MLVGPILGVIKRERKLINNALTQNAKNIKVTPFTI
jgi:hypothetical protein